MPARRKIQKEDIIQESVTIVSQEGINALNARKIAKKLGCSTQPLFYIYENMDDLKKASNEASIAASIKTAADKKKALGESLFTEIIKELKANGVDEETVNGLESEIARATDKNEALLKVIQKGDIIANKVLEIVNNII